MTTGDTQSGTLVDPHSAPRVMVVDFNGLGSACLAVPVFKALERAHPGIAYSYPENALMADPVIRKAGGIDGLLALTPPLWRRFYRKDWQDLADFIDGHAIDTVVNFRNRDLAVDPAYAEFRTWFGQRGYSPTVSWHDLYGVAAVASLSGQERMRRVLAEAGLAPATPFEQHWLRPLATALAERRPVRPGRRVGLFCGASTFSKRWPAEHWAELVRRLAGDEDLVFEVFCGATGEELDAALDLVEQLGEVQSPERMSVVPFGSLGDLLPRLLGLSVLVVGDTGIGHLAGSCRVPTVSLFLSTDPGAWAPASELTVTPRGRIGEVCPHQRPLQGNCTYYYDGCDAPCRWDLLPRRVAGAVHDALARGAHGSFLRERS